MDAAQIVSWYQDGINHKTTINLYETVTRNEDFYVGNQWAGSPSTNLPKPVINIIKRACQQKIASVNSNKLSVKFSAPNYPSEAPTTEQSQIMNAKLGGMLQGNTPTDIMANDAECALINGMFECDWERMNMDITLQNGMLDACVSGDMILFTYWDPTADTQQTSKGQICNSLIDNVNYHPANPKERDPQKQRHIIISMREMLEDVQDEAKANKVKQEDIDAISSDMDYQYQSGSMSKFEQQNTKMVTTLVCLFKNKEGTISAIKTCKDTVIRKEWDTKLTRYPLAIMNWELRKNSCFGRPEITSLIPNQTGINKAISAIMLYTQQAASPKILYNQSQIRSWNNSLTKPIAVNGDINTAAKYLQPASMPSDMYNLPTILIKNTLDMMGSNEASLGNINPTNANAIAMSIGQTKIPIYTIQQRFYAFIKEFARNWLDMTLAYYPKSRYVEINDNKGNTYPAVFEADKFKGKVWSAKINIGASKDWTQSDFFMRQDRLVQSGQLDVLSYYMQLPEEAFNGNKDEVINSIKAFKDQQAQQQMALKQSQSMPQQLSQMGMLK